MATDRDDEVSRRYRMLATEEPPGHLDAAILAQSRRAVGARPAGIRRWGPPLSIAAVLVLASGVVIRMQAEKPGIESAAPAREEATAPIATSPGPKPAPQPAKREAKPFARQGVKPEGKPVDASAGMAEPQAARAGPALRANVQPAGTSPVTVSPPPAPASLTAPAPAPAPAAAAGAAADAASTVQAPQPLRAPMQRDAAEATARRAPQASARHKSELLEKRSAPEAALARIERLRRDGRDDEADKALEKFQRDYPEYRLDDAQWERVKRRLPR